MRRVATAAVGMPLTILVIVVGNPWLSIAIAALVGVGLIEFYRMVERGGYRPVWEAGIIGGMLFVFGVVWPEASWEILALPALLIYTMMMQLRGGRPERALVNAAVTILGALYVGYLFSFVVKLRGLPVGLDQTAGPAPVLLVVFVVWAADTAAYFVGLAAGRHKLLPQISPNKSLEGAGGGVLAGIAVGLLCGWAFRFAPAMAATVGGACAVASIFGDLWESAIKREMGVKDAGGILPGHGGILDRFDGLLFAIVVGYYMMLWWPKS